MSTIEKLKNAHNLGKKAARSSLSKSEKRASKKLRNLRKTKAVWEFAE